ncbi:MAG: hypothetical protein ABIO57_04125 [Candidatus Paceibacterota bacterium]
MDDQNGTYVPEETLDIDVEEDENGNPIDAIEKNQTEEELTDADSKKQLEDGIIGDDDNQQDTILDA